MDTAFEASSILEDRRQFTQDALDKIRTELGACDDIRDHPKYAVYATGSYARQEASQYSDLDAFLITKKCEHCNIPSTLISSSLIKTARKLQLPEFSNDGAYLKLHSLDGMQSNLGSREDDYENLFTARMLLLLESVPIANKPAYDEILLGTIDLYYRDFHDHDKDFRPVFLVNDIVRFWKTLCLNYENKREREGDNVANKKNKAHLQNLKLKFSRLTTCFSTLVALMAETGTIPPDRLFEIVSVPPRERLSQAANTSAQARTLEKEMLELYAWFLHTTGKNPDALFDWIAIKSNRDEAFVKARRYGELMWQLLLITANRNHLRYLVI